MRLAVRACLRAVPSMQQPGSQAGNRPCQQQQQLKNRPKRPEIKSDVEYGIGVELPGYAGAQVRRSSQNRQNGIENAKPGPQRFTQQPPDPETVKNRLSVYHEQTQPLIDYYSKKGVLAEVDGTQSMENVFNAIVDVLGK